MNQLGEVAMDRNGVGLVSIKRLQAAITSLADAKEDVRKTADEVLVQPLRFSLAGLKAALNVSEITRANLPARARLGLGHGQRGKHASKPPRRPIRRDNEDMRKFARASLHVEPNAIGRPDLDP